MNPLDDQLNRLFRSAAKGRSDAIPPVPYGLETRAMAAWREGRLAAAGIWDTAVFVRGLALACLIMAISFWPVLNGTTVTATTVANTTTSNSNPFADFLQLTDSTVSSGESQ